MKHYFYIFALVFLVASPLFVERRGGGKVRKFYLDVHLGLGAAGAGMSGASSFLITNTIGASVGFRPKGVFMIGASTNYSFLMQYSDPTTTGNMRGDYFNYVSPMIGFFLGQKFILKTNIQFLGNYSLINKTIGGESVAYSGPFGFRVSLTYMGKKKLKPTLFFETVSFSKQSIEGVESTLASAMSMWQAGLMLSFIF